MLDEPLLVSFLLEQYVIKARWNDGCEAALSKGWTDIK